MSRALLEQTKTILEKQGLTPDTVHYGQHFLIDEKTIQTFVKECKLSPESLVLEIGPGLGYITKELAKQAKQVIAVEIDPRICVFLRSLATKYSNIKTVCQNALELTSFDYDVVCGALSYSIFEPLLRKFITWQVPKRAVFIVSKKFVDDWEKQTGLASLMCEAFFETQVVEILPQEFFYPKPKFKGALIVLKKRKSGDLYHFVLRELFLQGDKKLKNALQEALIRCDKKSGKELTKRQAKEKLNILLTYRDMEDSIFQASKSFLTTLVEFLKKEFSQ